MPSPARSHRRRSLRPSARPTPPGPPVPRGKESTGTPCATLVTLPTRVAVGQAKSDTGVTSNSSVLPLSSELMAWVNPVSPGIGAPEDLVEVGHAVAVGVGRERDRSGGSPGDQEGLERVRDQVAGGAGRV